MTTETSEYLSCADTAKLVRAALKREFPGVKFSVRSHTYSMGASIRVSWTDGPLVKDVDAVVGDYAGGRFDGMIDLAYHAEHWLTPDGVATLRRTYGHSYDNPMVTPDRPEGARLVHFGADYVFTRRELSDAFSELVRSRPCPDCHVESGDCMDRRTGYAMGYGFHDERTRVT